jgi:hypothetical protein
MLTQQDLCTLICLFTILPWEVECYLEWQRTSFNSFTMKGPIYRRKGVQNKAKEHKKKMHKLQNKHSAKGAPA